MAPRDRMALELLDARPASAGAVDREVDQGAGVRERLAQRPRVDLEGDRVLAAAVDDAGHLPSRRRRRAPREPSGSRA